MTLRGISFKMKNKHAATQKRRCEVSSFDGVTRWLHPPFAFTIAKDFLGRRKSKSFTFKVAEDAVLPLQSSLPLTVRPNFQLLRLHQIQSLSHYFTQTAPPQRITPCRKSHPESFSKQHLLYRPEPLVPPCCGCRLSSAPGSSRWRRSRSYHRRRCCSPSSPSPVQSPQTLPLYGAQNYALFYSWFHYINQIFSVSCKLINHFTNGII